jgi:hypothetical protein
MVMETFDDNMIDGILLEDIATPDACETTCNDGAELNVIVVLRSFIAPFVLTVASSWVIRNGAALVWLASLAVGWFYLVRRMSLVEAVVVTVVYVPLMMFVLLYLVATVPTGFHISE